MNERLSSRDSLDSPESTGSAVLAPLPSEPPSDLTRDLQEAQEALEQSEQERRRLAEQLEAERSRSTTAQRVANVGSWETDLTDLSTMTVLWSDETHRIFETDPTVFQPTYHAFLALVHPEDRTKVDDALTGSFASGRDAAAAQQRRSTTNADTNANSDANSDAKGGEMYANCEHRLLLPNDRVKFVEERWQVFFDDQGKPLRAVGACHDITERKQAEEATHFLASIVESSDDSTITINFESTITSWNKAAERLYGYSAEEAIGNSVAMLTLPGDLKTVLSNIERIKHSETVEIFDTIRLNKAGQEMDLEVVLSPVKDASGQVVGVSTLARDITKRKQADEALRSMMSSVHCLLWQADVQESGTPDVLAWDLTFPEESAAQRFLPLSIASGESYSDAAYRNRHPEDKARTDAYGLSMIRRGESYSQEYRCLGADGVWHWQQERVNVETLQPGIWRVVGVGTDITERKQMEEALVQSQNYLSQILGDLPVGVFVVDERGTPTYSNEAARQILGAGIDPDATSGALAGVYQAYCWQ